MAAARPPLACCFGSGGAYGVGFDMGVAAGLLEGGVDLTEHPMIGTSAGGYTVAALVAGIPFDSVAEQWTAFAATAGRIWVRTADLTEKLYGTGPAVETCDVSTVALRLLTWRRVLLGATDHPLSDIVAASASPIPFARPHRIGRRRYVDGGLRRLASADMAPAADVLVLVTPFCGRGQGLLGKVGARQARKEVPRWQAATGGAVLHVQPSAEIRSMGITGWSGLADMEVARTVFDLAVDLGRQAAADLRRDFPAAAARLGRAGQTDSQ